MSEAQNTPVSKTEIVNRLNASGTLTTNTDYGQLLIENESALPPTLR